MATLTGRVVDELGNTAEASVEVTIQSASCLDENGPVIVFTGESIVPYSNTSLLPNTRLDARGRQWRVPIATNQAVRIAGGPDVCFYGGEILGSFSPNTSWATMHDKYGLLVRASNSIGAAHTRVTKTRVFNYGDGLAFDAAGDQNWEVRDALVRYSRDDGIENDFYCNGLLLDSFLDGCYDGISSREYTSVADGSGNLVRIERSLIRLQAMDSVYSGLVPNHNAFWKWHARGPKIALRDVTFRADSPSKEGNGAGMWMAPPPGKLVESANNVMVWLGDGPFPELLPNGFTLLTGQEGLDHWDSVVSAWEIGHPTTLPDIQSPAVSLFRPLVGGVVSGFTTLWATAVDDRKVVGVQFAVDGIPVEPEQLVPIPLVENALTHDLTSKYAVIWNTTEVANGTHQVSAIARDSAGNVGTAVISVMVSN